MTRETWLLQLADLLRPLFMEAGYALPSNLRIACGWPTKRATTPSGKNRTLGQCFSSACSAAGRIELFISLAVDHTPAVAAILVHELCHAALNCEGGHGPIFRRAAVALGLEGKMTSTVAGLALAKRLNALTARLPEYPHAALDVSHAEKKAGTRLLKVACPSADTPRESPPSGSR